MEWLDALSGVASGGIFGLIGSIVGTGGKWLQEGQRQKWEKQKWAYEIKLHQLESQTKREEGEREIEAVNAAGSWQGMTSSHESYKTTGKTSQWVNNARSLFRPLLTIILWVLAAAVFYYVISGIQGITETEASELVKYMVYSVFFSASTATVWWFGDRALSPPGMKNR